MRILVLNCGSSTLKVRLLDSGSGAVLAIALVDRVGSGEGERSLRFAASLALPEVVERTATPNHGAAIEWLASHLPDRLTPDAIGHRVVHGGEAFVRPVLLTDTVIQELERLSRLAPLHNPAALSGIASARARFPALPQVAAFDTAFHASLPEHAYRYALPEPLYREHGVRRYGFHGLSHQYVSRRAAVMLGREDLRLVSLHLGNGCSAAAVRAGQCVDTSMGFTPLEGLVMGTRSGDLDPAVPLYLQRELGLTAEGVDRLLNRESGLAGLCGHADMREVEARAEAGDPMCRLALSIFCYRIRKYLGAYAAALGGLDAVIFTAGIGENSTRIRQEVCRGLEFLGVTVDPAANTAAGGGEREISAPSGVCKILVIPTNEEWVIAQETAVLLSA